MFTPKGSGVLSIGFQPVFCSHVERSRLSRNSMNAKIMEVDAGSPGAGRRAKLR
jgi:hypothetical protein